MKSYRTYVAVFVVLFVIAVISELAREKSIDWTDTFSRADKIPHGAWILYDQLEHLFPGHKIDVVTETAFQHLHLEQAEPEETSVYIFINDAISFSDADADALLEYVNRGGAVMIAAEHMTGPLFDSLGVGTRSRYFQLPSAGTDTIHLELTAPSLRSDHGYDIPMRRGYSWFETVESPDSYVVETVTESDSTRKATGVRITFGAGTFLLSSLPRSFTNVALLAPGSPDRASRFLSYLPKADVQWDEYYKPQDYGDAELVPQDESIARYIKTREPLRLAWYLMLGAGLLFVLFGLKRRQRPIPIVEPPRNATLDFVQTVGTMYHQSGDFGNLAAKQSTYLLDFIRTQLNVPTTRLDAEFIAQVSERSGIDRETIRRLIEQAVELRSSDEYVEASRLMRFTDLVEDFYEAVEQHRGIAAPHRFTGRRTTRQAS